MSLITSRPSQMQKASGLPPLVIALGFVSLFTDIASDMIVPVMPVFLTVTLGASATFLGLIEGVADVVAAVLKGLGGVWADRRKSGNKPWLVGGYAISSLARPFISLAVWPWQVLCLRCVDRVGKGLRTSPRDSMITTAVPAGQRGRAFGFHRAMDHSGALLGGLLASGLLAWGLTERQIIGWSIAPGIVAVVTLLFFVKEAAQPTPKENTAKPRIAWSALPVGLRRFLPVAGLFALANSSDAFLLLKAKSTGVSTTLLPLLWAWIHVARIGANLIGGGLADRYGAWRTVALGWICYGLVYALVAMASQQWQMWALLGIYGIYSGLTEGGAKVIVSSLAMAEARGAAFGAFHFVTGILALPASLLTGFFWDRSGPMTALIISASIALVAAVMLTLIKPPSTEGA